MTYVLHENRDGYKIHRFRGEGVYTLKGFWKIWVKNSIEDKGEGEIPVFSLLQFKLFLVF